jgi:hypothetical protein
MVALHLSAGKNEVSVYRAGVGPLIDLHFDAINIIRALMKDRYGEPERGGVNGSR